jgi:diadenosine tetraphosphate (Ap4A) HIT family hydrolase
MEKVDADSALMTNSVMTTEHCPFCRPEQNRIISTSGDVLVLSDGYPVSEGHTLVVPHQHVGSIFALDERQQAAIWTVVAGVRDDLSARLSPDAFNIGVNDGVAAGQTVMHAHIHIIPRFAGDIDDPRGGVRWVLPERAAYWR